MCSAARQARGDTGRAGARREVVRLSRAVRDSQRRHGPSGVSLPSRHCTATRMPMAESVAAIVAGRAKRHRRGRATVASSNRTPILAARSTGTGGTPPRRSRPREAAQRVGAQSGSASQDGQMPVDSAALLDLKLVVEVLREPVADGWLAEPLMPPSLRRNSSARRGPGQGGSARCRARRATPPRSARRCCSSASRSASTARHAAGRRSRAFSRRAAASGSFASRAASGVPIARGPLRPPEARWTRGAAQLLLALFRGGSTRGSRRCDGARSRT